MKLVKNARSLAAVICVSFVLPGLAAAQERPDSTEMTCSQVSGLVASQGGAVVASGPNIYDRYVVDRSFCSPVEVTEPAWVTTRDQPRCFIGYTCKDLSSLGRSN
jgi:hypothetical protein